MSLFFSVTSSLTSKPSDSSFFSAFATLRPDTSGISISFVLAFIDVNTKNRTTETNTTKDIIDVIIKALFTFFSFFSSFIVFLFSSFCLARLTLGVSSIISYSGY